MLSGQTEESIAGPTALLQWLLFLLQPVAAGLQLIEEEPASEN